MKANEPEWTEKLIGLDASDAREFLDVDGWTLRVVKRDGMITIATQDYRSNRLNVEVVDNTITKVIGVG